MARDSYRIGEAAKVLGVRVETLRRWEREGSLTTVRSGGGQRLVPTTEVARLLAERRPRHAAGAVSRRNAFPGVVTKVTRDKVTTLVEIQAGPHRVVSLITREAADELALKPGIEVVASVKATSVMVEVPDR
jgi:molybdopterin-binding protein